VRSEADEGGNKGRAVGERTRCSNRQLSSILKFAALRAYAAVTLNACVGPRTYHAA
jgi:hypothetical protein